uniref:DUF4347 domain-containing protein n=1 Tax=Crateriforma spongiae TaxID=2724528 RepID=UPI001445C801
MSRFQRSNRRKSWFSASQQKPSRQRRRTAATRRRRMLVESLENRHLLAADQIVFVDPSVWQEDSVPQALQASADEVVVLDTNSDGLVQIADYLQGREDVAAINIISHGDVGEVSPLGNIVLNEANLSNYSDELAAIGATLSVDGDILLWGCNVAGVDGDSFVQAVASATGADVAASTDLTGSPVLGGNWDLEFSTGPIEATNLLESVNPQITLSHYRGGSLTWTVDANGRAEMEVFTVWRDGSVSSASFSGWSQSSSAIVATGAEQGGDGFAIRRQTFTRNLGPTPADFVSNWSSCCWVANGNNFGSGWNLSTRVVWDGPGTTSASPTVRSATIDIVAQGNAYNQNLNAVDPDGSPVNYEFLVGGNDPNTAVPGLDLDQFGNVSLSGAETAALALGRWAYKVRVTDASGAYSEREVLFVVQDPGSGVPNPNAPVLAPIGSQVVAVGQTLTFQASATDPDGDSLTVRAQGLPSGSSFPEITGPATPAPNNSVSSTFSWTPGPADVGTYTLNVEAFDNVATPIIDSEQVQITVTGANTQPVLNPIGNRTTPNETNINFTISGSDADAGDLLTYSASFMPAGATFNPVTGEFDWTPSPAQSNNLFTGIVFRATDDGIPNLFDEETISITVGAGNQPPVFTPVANQTIGVGQPVSFTVSATDSAGQTIDLTPVAIPAGSSFASTSGQGSVSSVFNWTPATSGPTFLRFKAQDNGSPGASSFLDVTINVVANQPPNADNDEYNLLEGGTLATTDADGTTTAGDSSDDGVAANDSDPDGDPLSVTLISGPSFDTGTFALNPDGTFAYTHDGSENFTDTFVYQADDGEGNTDTATVTLHITPVNDAPTVDLNGMDGGIDFNATFTEDGGAVSIVDSNLEVSDPDAAAPGSIFLADSLGDLIRIDPSSGTQAVVSQGNNFDAIQGLTIDSDGSLLTFDHDYFEIVRVDPVTGAQTLVSDTSIAGNAGLDGGHSIVVEADGNIIVGRHTGISRVDPNTGVATTINSSIPHVHGLALEANGNILAASMNGTVTRIDANTLATTTIATGLNNLWGITVDDNGQIFVVDTTAGEIIQIDPNTFAQSTFASGGDLNSGILGITRDWNGNFLVSDDTDNEIIRIDASTSATSVVSAGDKLQAPFQLATTNNLVLQSATATITNLLDGSDEVLAVDTSGTPIVASYDSGTGVLSLTGAASIADYQAVLRTLTYENASQQPNETDRIVQVIANDGLLDNAIAMSTVSVDSVNDVPSLSNLAVTPSINEHEFAILTGTIGDADTTETFTMEVDWADGNTNTFVLPDSDLISVNVNGDMVAWDATAREFQISHQYLDDNPTMTSSDDYTITIASLTDSAGTEAIENSFGSLRPNVMLSGNSNRDITTFFPNATSFNVVSGNTPDANTQALFVTRSGLSGLNATNLQSYVNNGGIIITEYNISDEVFNLVFDENVTQPGSRDGDCSDAINPAIQLNTSDPFWQDLGPITPQNPSQEGCGFDLSSYPGITPLGAWASGAVQLAYRDSGLGRLWLVDTDWQDNQSTPFAESEAIMGYMMTHNAISVAPPSVTTTVNNDVPEFDDLAGDFGNISLGSSENGVLNHGNIDFSDDGTLDVHTVTVDFGDGGPLALHTFNVSPTGSRSFNLPTYAYTNEGTFQVIVTLTDDDSGSVSESFDVTVNLNDPPVAVSDTITLGEDDSVTDISGTLGDAGTGVLGNDSDPDGDTPIEIVAINSPPTPGILALTGGVLTYDPSGDFEALAAGESTTETFTYEIADPDGETDSATVTLTIIGTNDAPAIIMGASDSGNEALTETNSGLSVSRTLSVEDLDTTDVVGASIESVVVTGDDSGIGDQALLSMMSVGGNPVIDGSSTTGTINWTFDSGSEAFDHLAVGESLVLQYTIRATDSQSASDDQTVTVTINGTNDHPEITACTAGAAGPVATTLVGTLPGSVTSFGDAVFDSSGNAYVTSRVSNGGDIFKITPLNVISSFLSPGVGSSQTGLAIDGTTLYTSNSGGQIFTIDLSAATPAATLLTSASNVSSVNDIAIAPANSPFAGQLVYGDVSGRVARIDMNSLTETLITNSTSISALGFDSNGDLYYSGGSGTLRKFASGSETTVASGLGPADSLAIHLPTGDVYVGDSGANILRVSSSGVVSTFMTNIDFDNGFFHDPLAFSPDMTSLIYAEGESSATVSRITGFAGLCTGSVAETLTETDSGLTVGGTLSVEDLDTTDAVDASVEAVVVSGDEDGMGSAALLAMMSVGANPVVDGSSTTGTINWTFDSGSEAFNHLAVGEALVLEYTIRAKDSQNASDDQTVTITINGTNDAPDITVGSSDSDNEALTETDSGLSVSRTLSVEDLDTTDVVGASVGSVVVTGDDNGIGDPALLSMMSVGANPVIDGSSTTGTINWTFDSGSEGFDHLAVGESIVLEYTITATDAQLATDVQTVTITVNGTNDAPIIDSAAQAATVTESSDTNPDADPGTETGTITFDDVDLSDAHVASQDGGTVTTATLDNGLILTPAQETAILAAFSIDPSVAFDNSTGAG